MTPEESRFLVWAAQTYFLFLLVLAFIGAAGNAWISRRQRERQRRRLERIINQYTRQQNIA